ncbi:hypothetical protein ESB00_00865 [Oleiharenicola lentus]|jgi:opacity protein-like surface antigen|uniref:Porin family protein n=1 Tax=Oleiharenicola lentus TaxID=2508720 RepID=A0A4Q1C6I4_9BACT|nr:hypothetical protein [Oleiharenicola lentus]RXK54483.1 hypothetical protein ESB00_00865 [Oleiharenicola lentus]
MKQTTTLKHLLLAATLVAGFGTAARADDSLPPADQPAPITSDVSLLGLSYATLTYSYINLDGTSVHADDYAFEFNQPLSANLDGVFAYDYAQTSVIAGSRLKTQTLSAALRAFSTAYSWGKPFAEAGVGYARSRLAGDSDDSFVWSLGVGAELRVSSRATVTPYIRYVDAPDLDGSGVFNFGARASYWINTSWAATAGFEVDDDKNTAFTVGTNFRF